MWSFLKNKISGKYRKVFINQLKELYMAKIYKELGLELTSWSAKHLGLSSQSANAFIADVMVQFGKYRKTLIETSKWTDEEKEETHPLFTFWKMARKYRILRICSPIQR